jgi:hypothetical protein
MEVFELVAVLHPDKNDGMLATEGFRFSAI